MDARGMDYGLIGEKLSHSHSKKIHAMLADYRYELVELAPDRLDAFLGARGFLGLNVTIPYKRAVMAHCDELSGEARALGNVNTLLLREGRLIGHNTDLFGFQAMVARSGVRVQGKKAAVLGSGGAGLTARHALLGLGAREVITVSRRGPVDYEALYRDHSDAQLIVNATPVGMFPKSGESPVDLGALPGAEAVLDMIYNPFRTALLLDAQERNLPSQNGLMMLVAQAARAAALFTGTPVDPERIEQIRTALQCELKNLVLIGMPGCGKTSVGRALAERMGREFVDIDQRIEQSAGLPIPEIFRKYGEPRFRSLERACIAETAKRQGLVVATGGGAVLDGRNARALRQNGELIFLERPLDMLATQGRPLSIDRETLGRMVAERLPLYQQYSRLTIRNTDSIERAAQEVQEGFYEIAGD